MDLTGFTSNKDFTIDSWTEGDGVKMTIYRGSNLVIIEKLKEYLETAIKIGTNFDVPNKIGVYVKLDKINYSVDDSGMVILSAEGKIYSDDVPVLVNKHMNIKSSSFEIDDGSDIL